MQSQDDFMIQKTTNIWITLSRNLKPKEYSKPVPDNNVYIWIHKYFEYNWGDNTPMYKYELFSSELKPIQLIEGNFTCTMLEDHCISRGCGNFYSIKFGIIDKNNVLRTGNGLGQQEEGIIETIKLMREIARYEDWAHYDLRS